MNAFMALLNTVLPTIALVLSVLGTIYSGHLEAVEVLTAIFFYANGALVAFGRRGSILIFAIALNVVLVGICGAFGAAAVLSIAGAFMLVFPLAFQALISALNVVVLISRLRKHRSSK